MTTFGGEQEVREEVREEMRKEVRQEVRKEEMEEEEVELPTLLDTDPTDLDVDDVYTIAAMVGRDFEQMVARGGSGQVAQLMPKVVRVLEILEVLVANSQARGDGPASAEGGESSDDEQLQQQLSRLIKINNELRHKLAVMEAQGKSLIEQKVELEADLQSREQEIGRLRETAASVASAFLEQSECQEGAVAHHPGMGEDKLSFFPGVEDEEDESVWMDGKLVVDLKDPNRPRFTLQELREVLQERNELKAKLFLLQEELAYYKSEDSDLDPSPPVRALPSQHAIVKPSPQDSGIRRLFSFFYKDRPAGMRKLSVESARPGDTRQPATAPEQRPPNDGEAADASGLTGSTATLKSISLNP
ncbi:RILP-like protein 1 isoform X3 [Lampetra planeri]